MPRVLPTAENPQRAGAEPLGCPGGGVVREPVGVKQRESKCRRGWRVRRRQCNNLYRLVSFRKTASTGVWNIILGPLTKLLKIRGFRVVVQKLTDFKINRKVDRLLVWFFLLKSKLM